VSYGAWFIAASYRKPCAWFRERNGSRRPATNKEVAALHPGANYKCVDGGPGTFATLHPEGYKRRGRGLSPPTHSALAARGQAGRSASDHHGPPRGGERAAEGPGTSADKKNVEVSSTVTSAG